MVWYRGGIYLRKKWLAAAIVLLALCSAGFAEEARNITKECRFWVSEGSAYNISNSSLASSWKPEGAEPEMRIMLPDGGVAACVQIDWRRAPEEYTLTEYDANQTPFFTHTAAEDSFPCLSQLYEPNSNAKYISIKFTTPEQGISRIRVFSAGELPNTVVRWEPPCEKADLLVVSAHQDDEWLWFGGIIPYYDLVRDKNVQVVYMAKGGRLRYGEALNGLAVAGVRTYPHFIGLKDKHDSSLEAAVKTWTSMDHILNVLVEVIRRYKPEVILTHDWNGEYGHPQHQLTSRVMEYAIAAAADPAQYSDSAAQYGAWQVKKLYRHLEEKCPIEFDWHVAYPEFGGRTGLQVATDSMNEHVSQLQYYQVRDHGKYDNALFGLSYSTVGDDVLHEDLFENIPESAPAAAENIKSSPEPSAAPAAEVEAAPTAAPEITAETAPADNSSPEPALTGAPSPEPAPVAPTARSRERNTAAPLLIAGCGVVAAAFAYLYFTSHERRRRRRRRRKRR